MTSIKNFFKGKKTHIIAFLLILVSLTEFFSGDITITEFLGSENFSVFLNGAGLSTLRAGIAKIA